LLNHILLRVHPVKKTNVLSISLASYFGQRYLVV
jgi:hypothetical protein